MAITTYGELKSAVANWLNQGNLTTYIPDLIRLGEQRIYFGGADPLPSQPLRVPAMQAQSTGTISSSTIAFPTRFVEPIRLAASSGGETWTLDYASPAEYSAKSGSSGLPTVYTYLNNSIVTAGTGAASYILDYYQSFALLSSDSDTNWLLTNAPGVYLYAALVESVSFIKDDPRIPQWLAAYKASVAALNNSTKRQGGGSLQMRVMV